MPIQVLNTRHPSAGEQIANGLVKGINHWTDRKTRQQEYKQQIATQTVAQERLMEFAHQQRLQEITYQQRSQKPKGLISHRPRTCTSTNGIGFLSGSAVFSAIAILIVAGMAMLILIKPTDKV